MRPHTYDNNPASSSLPIVVVGSCRLFFLAEAETQKKKCRSLHEDDDERKKRTCLMFRIRLLSHPSSNVAAKPFFETRASAFRQVSYSLQKHEKTTFSLSIRESGGHSSLLHVLHHQSQEIDGMKWYWLISRKPFFSLEKYGEKVSILGFGLIDLDAVFSFDLLFWGKWNVNRYAWNHEMSIQ